MSEAVLAEYLRDGIVESKHFGHLVALDPSGKIVYAKGDPDAHVFPRSAIKSIQASAMVRNGLKLEPRLLALACASHSGAKMHQDGALAILNSVGLDENALQNIADRQSVFWNGKSGAIKNPRD